MLEAHARPSSVQVQDTLGVWTGAEESKPVRDKDLVLVAYGNRNKGDDVIQGQGEVGEKKVA